MSVRLRAADRLALFGCVTVGVIVGLAQATGVITDPYDARAYWEADPSNLYLSHWIGGYVYAPPMALLLGVFHPIGWPVFIVAFTTATWWAFWYLTRAWAPLVLIASLALVPLIGGNVIGYLFIGNVQVLMAAAIVASIRGWSGWSLVPILTKGVGIPLVWFAVRREWRSLGVAVGATAAVVGLSLLLAPDTWAQFLTFASANVADSPIPLVPIPFPVRLIAAVVLTAWGALTDRRWTVVVAAGIAIPALYPWSFLAVWIGVIVIEWKAAPAAADTTVGSVGAPHGARP